MNKKVVIILLLFFIASFAGAQSPAKEAMNFFAHYSQKHQFSDLEKAKKAIDEGFKTKRDSLSYRNNLIRGMVYSTLAFVDSNRKLSKEPIQIGLHSLSSLTNSKFNEEHGGEISYIKKQLANAFLREAAKFLKDFNYEDAYDSYRWVDSLNSGTSPAVKHNLAVLSQRLGYRSRAIGYYEQLIEDKPKASPVYYLALSELYEAQLDLNKSLDIIKKGREAFPHNQDLLFKEINIYADNGIYEKVAALIESALKFEPENISLIYLAGFSAQHSGMRKEAENYYQKIISLAPNNYDANYSLGLLYLRMYTEQKNKEAEVLDKASFYLNKAVEINPNSINVLKSLSILYKESGNMLKLEQVNNKLHQIILN